MKLPQVEKYNILGVLFRKVNLVYYICLQYSPTIITGEVNVIDSLMADSSPSHSTQNLQRIVCWCEGFYTQ